MIPLDRTTRKLQAALAGAVAATQPQVLVGYYDVPAQTKATFEQYQSALYEEETNGATLVDICPAPSINGTIRNVHHICVHNSDSASVTVTISLNDNGTTRKIKTSTLTAGQSLVYEDGAGWQVL